MSLADRTKTLEPIRPALFWVSLVHLALLAGLTVFILPRSGLHATASASPILSANTARELAWFRPAEFQTSLPITPAASIPTADPPPPDRTTSRYITLSRLNSSAPTLLPKAQDAVAVVAQGYVDPKPPGPLPGSAPAIDTAALDLLDQIDRSLYEAFMQVWQPPAVNKLSILKTTVRLDIRLGANITLDHFDLATPSGSNELDLSVLNAAEHVASLLRNRNASNNPLKFPHSLPSPFQNSGYDCRIQFQIE
jgi:hypothetical protein